MSLRPLLIAALLTTAAAGASAHPAYAAYAAYAAHPAYTAHPTHPAYRGDPAATPRIDARQARQAARIRHGLASGALTPREAAWLRVEQRHIARVERRAQADGVVTRHERARLTALQDRASRHIRGQARDAQHGWR